MKWVYFLIILIGLTGCYNSAPQCSHETSSSVECITAPDSIAKIINRARHVVLSSDLQLSDNEKKMVLTEKPEWGIYPMAGFYSQYSFEWKEGRVRIGIEGQGDIYKLDGSNYVYRVVD